MSSRERKRIDVKPPTGHDKEMDNAIDDGGREMQRGRTIARWLLTIFYAVAGVGHLLATDAMVRIVPAWVPFPHAVVIATGVCELAGVVALLTPRWRRAAGWAFAAYAVCVYPANVKHAIHDLGTGTGLPIWYHGPRLLLQPVIVWWALWATRIVDWPFGKHFSRS